MLITDRIMEETLKTTCLHDRHVALGAQMSPFGGFDMPIQYSGIIEEHNAVRHACGMFDVSHMGEILVSGPQAEEFVGYIFTNDVRGLEDGRILYGMMLYHSGGTVDDLLVYKFSDSRWLLVVNASNIEKDFAWVIENAEGYDVQVDNLSDFYGEIALQGPDSERIAKDVLGLDLSGLEFYGFVRTVLPPERDGMSDADPEARPAEDEPLIVSRTGYTGEDGFEFYGSFAAIRNIWDRLMAAGVTPCGLGCRDTLRFEVGLPLYGHELSQDISPVEAGLGMFVKMDKPSFIGKEVIGAQKTGGVTRKIVGIELRDKAIPRAGYPVESEGEQIGEVTTGYNSISTGKSVCMAMLRKEFTAQGTEVQVRIRKKLFPGVVCKKRFYDKNYKK